MKRVLLKAINPLRILINDTRFIGLMLITCTLISIYLANTVMFASDYKQLWNRSFPIFSSLSLPESFLSWINNFLMAFFFLMAGMEIKRELIKGELSSFKKAVLPFGAALGGMIVPALIFVAFNIHTSYIHGWGIPTATDIAFSIGIASLLGKRIPDGLKILLMALAIIDDLGAIIVIALFYGGQVNWLFLVVGVIFFLGLFALNYFKVKFGLIQIAMSLFLWYVVFNSGIEASITGVLVAFAIPATKLPKIVRAIHRYVNFLIIPLFALANTAILLPDHIMSALGTTVGLGIIVGLVLGKPIGIYLFSWILVRCKVASLPKNVNWKQIFGMGTLAGIGFTMSIFTTMLAFKDEAIRDIAKVSILAGVAISLVFSLSYFLLISKHKKQHAKLDHKSSKSEGKLELDVR
ncbi:Na+/H+ antiporter NhaA type [Arcticibacter svalbardensis MN12-7]|uniref:Na(+)/H(+) antiporter NhaA n=1 Tax=Arcticibacter svalbardensis MN12-7 TaxID=1150600 RepID=R9GPG6_9SPHI|nr:Na+/H+ antiporter NhaA [Arcticibacter svalbardensis]EOR93717.1 Na+/H+ antiporter NhaA type [Arcticibacter svalbardensis MN12-7]